jgi:hypothetical protein
MGGIPDVRRGRPADDRLGLEGTPVRPERNDCVTTAATTDYAAITQRQQRTRVRGRLRARRVAGCATGCRPVTGLWPGRNRSAP